MRRVVLGLVAVASLLSTWPAHAGAWEYSSKEDKMSSSLTKLASITSDNSLSLQFPYQGENHGFLFVRQKAGHEPDVLVSVMKGQILCPGFSDGCTVTVRFDSGKPSRFSAIGPSDNSNDSFFILDTERFLAGARKAKRILVQFTMFQAGDQVLEFSAGVPLEWGAPPAKSKKK